MPNSNNRYHAVNDAANDRVDAESIVNEAEDTLENSTRVIRDDGISVSIAFSSLPKFHGPSGGDLPQRAQRTEKYAQANSRNSLCPRWLTILQPTGEKKSCKTAFTKNHLAF